MSRARISVLVGAAVPLGLARWLLPPGESHTGDGIVAAVARPPGARPARPAAPEPAQGARDARADVAPDDAAAAGNPFAVKAPPPPPPPPPPPKKPVVAAPPPSPPVQAEPSLPRMQVIGTYEDAAGPAVFVATADGTEIGRVGSLLLAEFRVTAITHQQVSLVQVSTQRAIHLSIPRQ